MPVGSGNLTISTCVIICPYSTVLTGCDVIGNAGSPFETFKPSDPSHLSPNQKSIDCIAIQGIRGKRTIMFRSIQFKV